MQAHDRTRYATPQAQARSVDVDLQLEDQRACALACALEMGMLHSSLNDESKLTIDSRSEAQ